MEAALQNGQSVTAGLRLASAAGAASMVAGSAVVAYFDPSGEHFFPVCPLYMLTGFACPGCGLTRGFHALFHGDISTAMHFNALIPLWAVIFSAALISLVLYAVRGRGLPTPRISPNWLWGLMILLLTFGILRNIPTYPFTLLFP